MTWESSSKPSVNWKHGSMRSIKKHRAYVATAHAAAREAKRQLEAELGETAKRLRSQMEAEQKQKLLQIEQDSEREAAAFDVTGDDQVQTIAIRVAGLLLAKGTTAEMPDTGARR